MSAPIRIKRTTRAQLNAAAGSSQLAVGEPYLITDEGRLGVGTSVSTYQALAKTQENSILDFGNTGRINGLPRAIADGQPLTYDQVNSARDRIARVCLWTDFVTTASTAFGDFNGGVISTGTVTVPTVNPPVQGRVGVVRINSSATANSGAWAAANALYLIAGRELFVSTVRFLTLTNILLRSGLHTTTNSTTPTDGVFFQLNAGTIVGATFNNSTFSTTASSFTPLTDVWYRFEIQINANATLVTFRIYTDADNVLVWSDTISTNIPTTRFVAPGAQVMTCSGTVATNMGFWDYMGTELYPVRGF